MRKREISKILYCVLITIICACKNQELNQNPAQPISLTIEEKIILAKNFEKVKNYQESFKIYSELLNEIDDFQQIQAIQISCAEILFNMQKYPAALNALNPMPENPKTINDTKKMIVAARILQKMNGKKEHIEALLKIAIENKIDENEMKYLKADGYVELGTFYIKNNNQLNAIKCFEQAEKLYNDLIEKEKAKICKNLIDYLN